MSSLLGKCALVTGASGGIGGGIARRLAAEGAAVALHYWQHVAPAVEVANEIIRAGGRAVVIEADLGDLAAVRRMFQDTLIAFGQLDIFVQNAAAADAAPLSEMTEQAFDAIMRVNVRGVFFAMKEAVRTLPDGGRIINISSSAAAFPAKGLAAYGGSKAAQQIFTNVLAQELGSRQITVNSVQPGPTEPGMFSLLSRAVHQDAIERTPSKRIGTPEDVAEVVAFLASDAGRWVNGQNILVNGGANL